MELLVWGLNHKTVPVSVREQFAVPPERIGAALSQSSQYNTIQEAVILSTCNRSEIYAVCPDGTTGDVLKDFFLSLLDKKPDVRPDYFYTYKGKDCMVHLLRVASSLDSQIIGEGQILSQVKQAYLVPRGLSSISSSIRPSPRANGSGRIRTSPITPFP